MNKMTQVGLFLAAIQKHISQIPGTLRGHRTALFGLKKSVLFFYQMLAYSAATIPRWYATSSVHC